MKKFFYKLTAIIIAVIMLLPICLKVFGQENAPIAQPHSLGAPEGTLNLNCKSAILMEATTGTILYTQNAEEALPPASVTKVMTLLLVMEAIDAGTIRVDDTVSVSANAASMGGSQVFLEEGEQMSVEDLLKSVVIASANDAAVALAEYVSGSVDAFVAKMNAKAVELGMTATHFENVTGLDDTAKNHLTSAKDIALMSCALVAHPLVLEYSSIWMDTIRDGAFGLTNTNRLVRYYKGCTGLKTGSTSKAGFCISTLFSARGLGGYNAVIPIVRQSFKCVTDVIHALALMIFITIRRPVCPGVIHHRDFLGLCMIACAAGIGHNTGGIAGRRHSFNTVIPVVFFLLIAVANRAGQSVGVVIIYRPFAPAVSVKFLFNAAISLTVTNMGVYAVIYPFAPVMAKLLSRFGFGGTAIRAGVCGLGAFGAAGSAALNAAIPVVRLCFFRGTAF